MRLVFIDDSEQITPRRDGLGSLLALGAVIVPGDQVAGYAEDLLRIKADIGVPLDEEIKWSPPRGSFLATAGGDVVLTLRRRMLDAAAAHQVNTAVVIVDYTKAYTGRSKAEVGLEILKWLYERITMHLTGCGDVGIVIADKPGGGQKEESRWLAETLILTNDGTEYVSPDRIVMPIVTGASHHVPHLQLAGSRRRCHDSGGCRAPSRCRPRAEAPATGPQEHAGLGRRGRHRHLAARLDQPAALGIRRETYAKVARNVGVPLPWREWLYFNDDGLPASSPS